jgi:UDP-N-acetylglucosamine--N-acetylmuramyl-(pentapeptide) pyrophosphoryl-undecaprenol N-acetylglucosamine transferase
LIAAGGTAGHINPALAVAHELTARGYEVTFFGQPRRLEGTLVPAAGYELVPVDVTGIDRTRPWTIVAAAWNLLRAQRAIAKRQAERPRPVAVVGFGAYIEAPLMRWAKQAGVPAVLHEQNSTVGLANTLASKDAAAICVAYPEAAAAFAKHAPSVTCELTGNPVREEICQGNAAACRERFGIAPEATLLVVFGGSLGAKSLNQALVANKAALLAIPGVEVLHATGKEGYETTVEALALTQEDKQRYHVVPYLDHMGDVYAAANLLLSRAGASSLAEIAATHTPAVLVPYPLAAENHQATNAAWLASSGGAVVVSDEALTASGGLSEVLTLLQDAGAREELRLRYASQGSGSATAAVADVIERAAAAGAASEV